MKRLTIAASVVAVGIVSVALWAYADEGSDRKNYIDKIEDLLEDTADYLDGVVGDSSASDIDYAIRKADDVADVVDDLKDVKGNDSTANEMVSKYPGYVNKFKESAQALKKLKERQYSVDKLSPLCAEASKRLAETIRTYVDKKDLDGLQKIPEMAEMMGKPIAQQLTDGKRDESELQRLSGNAKQFSDTHGEWSDVKSELHESATAIWDYWEDKWEDAEKVCKDWDDWDDHPAVKKAMTDLGDTDKLRAAIIKKFDEDLKETASQLREVHRSTSFDYATTKRQADKIERGINNLDKIKGTDRRANEIVDKWPGYITEYKAALLQLSAIKQRQYKLDELPKKCEDWERDLVYKAKNLASKKDLLALRDLVKEANEIGAKVKTGLKNADDNKSNRQRERDDARRLSLSDAGWRDISDNLKDSASGIYNYWEKALDNAHRSCDEIAKGSKHKDFADQLEDLEDETEDKIEALTTKVNQYITDRRAVTKMDQDNLKDLINDICKLDIESSSDEATRKANDMTSEMQRNVTAKYDELVKRYEVLLNEAEQYEAFPKGADLLKKLRGDKDTLDNIKDGIPKGMNNPKIAAATKYGQDKHKDMQGSSTYQCTEKEFPANGGRADCVSVPQCTIWEFKPSSHDPSAAQNQVDGYLSDVNKHYKGRSEADHCWADGKSGFAPKVKTYEACK